MVMIGAHPTLPQIPVFTPLSKKDSSSSTAGVADGSGLGVGSARITPSTVVLPSQCWAAWTMPRGTASKMRITPPRTIFLIDITHGDHRTVKIDGPGVVPSPLGQVLHIQLILSQTEGSCDFISGCFKG